MFGGCILGECNGGCILWKVTTVVGNFTFKREIYEPVMVIQTSLLIHMSLQLSSCACLNSLSTKYHWFLLKLIYICGHFLTVNNHHNGHCYVENFIALCAFLEFYTHLEANSARSFQIAFYSCSRDSNTVFSHALIGWLKKRLLSIMKKCPKSVKIQSKNFTVLGHNQESFLNVST